MILNLRRRRAAKAAASGDVSGQIKYEYPAGRVSESRTSFLRRKLEEINFSDTPAAGRRGFRGVRNEAGLSVSARKLGAALWQLLAEITATSASGVKPGVGHLRITFPIYHCSSDYGTETNPWLQKPLSNYGAKRQSFYKYKSSLPFPRFAMEGATKWDPGFSKTSTEVWRVFSHMKLLTNGPLANVLDLSPLQAELLQSRADISKLETEQKFFKKKVKFVLRKLGEEQTSWMKRDHQEVRAILDDLKHELNREKIICQRMEAANSKLLNDLAEAKLSAKKTMQDYEQERKTRKLIEEVCHDLANKVEEDTTKFEALKRGSVRIHATVEEERKMLQMAEVWREERAQMKLVDARLVLEEKYQQMNNLIANLATFLNSRDITQDMTEMSKQEESRLAVNSVDREDIKSHSFIPSKSGDINSTTENCHEDKKKETVQWHYCSDASHASEFSTMTSVCKSLVQKHPNGFVNDSCGFENTSGLETVAHSEYQDSIYSPHGSVYRISRGIHSTVDAKHEQMVGQEYLNSEISEICSTSVKQPNKRAAFMHNL